MEMDGDATNEEVLALCDVPHASAVIVLTNSDPGNLEIALARLRSPGCFQAPESLPLRSRWGEEPWRK